MMNNPLNYLKFIVRKFHLIWVLTYCVLIGGSAIAGVNLYHKYDQDRLPSGGVEFKISKTNYQPRESVEFTIVNNFPTAVYVINQCPSEPLNVYRWQNKEWLQIHDIARAESTSCSNQNRDVGILPEQTRKYNFNDWPKLFREPGTYRIVLSVNYSSELLFQDFNILEPKKVIEIPGPVKNTNIPVAPAVVVPVVAPVVPDVVVPEIITPEVPQEEIYQTPYERDDREENDD